MPLVESLLHDGVDERASVEEHALVALVVVLLGHLATPVGVALPKLHVADLLDLGNLAK